MLNGDLLASWKLWRKTESEKEKGGSFKKKATGVVYKMKYVEGDSDGVFKYCFSKVCQQFVKKYDVRKQKAYMRSSLQNPKSLSVDAISSRLKILNNYLTSFFLLDNKSSSQGEMIEIVLIMLPVVWVNIMITAGLESRKKTQ